MESPRYPVSRYSGINEGGTFASDCRNILLEYWGVNAGFPAKLVDGHLLLFPCYGFYPNLSPGASLKRYPSYVEFMLTIRGISG